MAVARAEQNSSHSLLIDCSLWAFIPSPTLSVSEKRHNTTPLSIIINYPSPTNNSVKIEESSFPQKFFLFDSHAKEFSISQESIFCKEHLKAHSCRWWEDYSACMQGTQHGLSSVLSIVISVSKPSPAFRPLSLTRHFLKPLAYCGWHGWPSAASLWHSRPGDHIIYSCSSKW